MNIASRVRKLDGLRLAILDNSKWNCNKMLRGVRELPKPENEDDTLGAEAAVSALPIDASDAEAPGVRREAIDRVGDQPIEPHAEQGARA